MWAAHILHSCSVLQWHKDPNATSAWNAVLSGSKYWLFLPPHVTPPGVYVSADEAEVTAPLSIAEWAIDFLEQTRTLHGPEGDGLLQEGRCEAGDAVYVPAGWWHLVVNVTGTWAEAPESQHSPRLSCSSPQYFVIPRVGSFHSESRIAQGASRCT